MPAHLPDADHESMGDDSVLYQIRVNGHLGSPAPAFSPAWRQAWQVAASRLEIQQWTDMGKPT
jgi:hypothetical protein